MKIQIDNATLAAIYITAYYSWGVLMWILTKRMSSWIPIFSIILLSFDKLIDGYNELIANHIPPLFMTFAFCVFMGYIK